MQQFARHLYVTAYGYCPCGALENVTEAYGITNLQQITQFVYDYQGNLLETDFPDGSVLRNKYDSLGRITNVIDGFSSVTNYYNNQGLLVTSSNAFGRLQSRIYDILDRATNTVDANGVTITNTYDNLNRLLTRGYPDGGVEKFGYSLNTAGPTSYTNQLDSNVVTYAYDALRRKTNEVQVGIGTTQFTYDAAGNLATLTDGRNNVTTWIYDAEGRLFIKKDANNTNLFTYGYFPTGWLSNRLDALGKNTKYLYDAVGNLTNIDYAVSTDIRLAYDALNRLTNMVDATGSATAFSYTSAGLIANEDGPWANDTVSYSYTNRLRSNLTLLQPNASSWTQTYGHDAARRLQTLSSPAGAFTYTYKGAGNLVTNLALPNGAAITNVFDTVARLTGTYLKNSGGTILNWHKYGYNVANQRTVATNFAGNYVNYTYDNIGQVKKAVGKESSGSLRLHEQLFYGYDAAGNLNYRTNNALVQTFGVNKLNELTNVTRNTSLTVAGTTTTNASSVTVKDNSNPAVAAALYADQTFARTNVSLLNGINTFTATAQDGLGRSDTNTVTVNLPATVTFQYDLNGNLTSDGMRGFDYDDENQLIRVTVTNSWKSEFVYDGRMRRRIRKEFIWNGTWLPAADVRYIYDGMLVIQERDGNNLATVTYTRGRDLSGSLEGAGGIGGLLARTSNSELPSPNAHAFYHADGNGNVTALVNGQQIIVAKYIYDPFGNILSKSGPLADANLNRFSSKEYHQPSGLVYYLYRFYDPNLQRWLTRDPLGEAGFERLRGRRPKVLGDGPNQYSFVHNDPVDRVDSVGLFRWPSIPLFYICPSIKGGIYMCIGKFTPPTFCPEHPIDLINCLQNAKRNMDIGCVTAEPDLFDVGCEMMLRCLQTFW